MCLHQDLCIILKLIIGNNIVQIASHYNYLGLLLTEFLDYNEMAKCVSKSANRALSLLIVKRKSNGGFQHSTFTKLFDTLVIQLLAMVQVFGTPEVIHVSTVFNIKLLDFL